MPRKYKNNSLQLGAPRCMAGGRAWDGSARAALDHQLLYAQLHALRHSPLQHFWLQHAQHASTRGHAVSRSLGGGSAVIPVKQFFSALCAFQLFAYSNRHRHSPSHSAAAACHVVRSVGGVRRSPASRADSSPLTCPALYTTSSSGKHWEQWEADASAGAPSSLLAFYIFIKFILYAEISPHC